MNRPQMTKRNRSRFVRNRKPSVRPSARLEQALYEMMEPRRVLNGVPVINPDPQYFTDVSTAVSITTNNSNGKGYGLLDNDFDADGPSSITVSGTANTTNGTITSWNSDGSFTFTPTTSFTGFASFTYTITDKWGNERNFDLESDNITGTLVSIKNLNNTANSYSFAYDSSNRLTTITDEFSRNYTLSYTSGLFNKIIHGNNLSTWELFPTLGEGLKTGTGNTAYVVTDNISTSGANAAKYIDERGYDFKFKTDQFSNVVSYFPKSARYAGSELAGPHENNQPRSTRW